MAKIIEICDDNGQISPMAPAMIVAATAYPEDEQKRIRLLCGLMADIWVADPSAFPDGERDNMAAALLPVVFHSPEPPKLAEEAERAVSNAWVSGEMLLMLLSAVVHHPDLRINPTKALSVLSRMYHGGKSYSGRDVKIKPRTAWNAWGTFKSVAHYYAFRQLWLDQLQGSEEPMAPDLWLHNFADFPIEDLIGYISITERLRTLAIERQILDYGQTWRFPDSLDLDLGHIEIQPLDDSIVKRIRDYVPEHSRDADLDEL